MHKGIRLKVKLWIEGEDEPAHHFADFTIEAVREILSDYQSKFPGLKIVVRKIEEDTSWDEDELKDNT